METFKIILLTVAVCVQVTSQQSTEGTPIQIPKPKITQNPTHKVLYSTETVTLHCEVPGGASELQYDWYKDSTNLETDHQSSITVTNGGNYECKAKNGSSESEQSDRYTLTLQEPPEPKLSIESEWKTFYPRERLTLKCSIDGGLNEWGYEWFINGTQLSGDEDISLSGNTLSISSAKASHSGQFTCRGKHLTRTPVTTRQTEALKLHINVNTPKPDIRKDPLFEFFYTEEKVQLGCNMTGDGWTYDWYKDSKTLITNPTFTISSASLSDTGVYHCKAKRGDFSVDSATLRVQVQDPPQPKLSIESEWKTFYPREKVTLKCTIDGGSTEWHYEWFRNGTLLSVDGDISFSGNTLSISSAKASHSGQFTCRGKHLARTPVTTRQTEALQLHINVNTPKPDIRKDPLFEFFYTEEKVQLGCKMPGDGWTYDWYKDSKTLITNPTFTIHSASPSDIGVYHCKAKRGDFSVDSATLRVQVQDPPQPKLSIESEWKTFYPREKVTLKCSIDGGSSEWGYEWFRNRTQLLGDEDISFSENTLSISSANKSHSGQFTCRGKHLTRTPVTTSQTEALQLDIYVNTPKPDIRKDPLFEFFYTEEKVQLGCKMPGDGWTYDWYKDSNILITNPTFTISSASLSDTGVYHCKAKRGDFSVDSATLRVQVQEPPQPKLSIESQWKTFYPTEKVTLKCSIDGGLNEWGYEWFSNRTQLLGDEDISFSGNTLSISSAKASHSGQFTCRGKHLARTPVTTRQTEALKLHINVNTPKPHIRKDPLFEFFYTKEKVQLGCDMLGDGWTYDWYKDSKPLNTDPTFTISSASLSDTGVYHCKAKRGNFSVDSETLQVHVQEPPQPKLSIESQWKTFYPREKVTLKCSIDGGSSEWGYEWFRNGTQLLGDEDISFSENTLSISSAKESHSGQFTCRGKHLTRTPVTTRSAEALQLDIYDNTPKPDITKHRWFELFYTGEKVQFGCNMTGDGWTYAWYKDPKPLNTDPTLTIRSASLSDIGLYHCKAKRGDFSVDSETLRVQVQELPQPKLSIESEWKTFYRSEKVTLKCSINSNEWGYEWFRNKTRLLGDEDISLSGNTLSISSAKASHSGQFTCRGKHLTRTPVTSKTSEALQLNIYVNTPKPHIRKDPLFEFFYTGEKVQLGCNMPGDGWTYDWYKDSKTLITNPTFTISSASLSDTGVYHCKAKRGNFSVDSETLQVQVQEPPEPKLSIESQWKTFYPTEKVTLKCTIDGGSSEWGYEWFRNGTQLLGDEDISFSGNTLSISSAKVSHSGQFTCRGKHLARTPVTTSHTKALKLHIYDDPPKPHVRKDPLFEFFYTEEKVQLGCNMTGDGWTYDWYKHSKTLITNPTFPIHSASHADIGVYHCKAKRGDFSVDSETLKVEVQARPPAVLSLETELSDIMSGNILTLRCNVSDSKQWSYAWFENGQKLNGSSDMFKVIATDENIKSEFKCKGIRTERPLYSALSEGFTANNILLKRKILLAISGCLVCCIVLLIIGCLVIRFTRKPEKKETPQEDLFFSMADSKNKTASPLEEYMDNGPTDMKECEEKEELLTDRVSAVCVDGVIKDEDSPASEANGLTSFKGL